MNKPLYREQRQSTIKFLQSPNFYNPEESLGNVHAMRQRSIRSRPASESQRKQIQSGPRGEGKAFRIIRKNRQPDCPISQRSAGFFSSFFFFPCRKVFLPVVFVAAQQRLTFPVPADAPRTKKNSLNRYHFPWLAHVASSSSSTMNVVRATCNDFPRTRFPALIERGRVES